MAFRVIVSTACARWGIAAAVTIGMITPLRADPTFTHAALSATERAVTAITAPVPQRHEFLGTQSCAAASCHGSPDRTDLLASAYHFAMDRDPHSQAGLVLYTQRSQDLVERRGFAEPAWKSRQCLVCHAPGAVNSGSGSLDSRLISDGVGCESCHGAAPDWLAAHSRDEWKFLWPTERKTAAGFINTDDLATRVRICADCHIGNADQQVTHDLIAAGHPRLSYEFAAYHAMLPPHWNREADRMRLGARFDGEAVVALKSWLLGQLVTAENHLEQVQASAADSNASWPELAHYDCFACHHDLTDPSWRQAHVAADLKPGQAAWGTWTLGLVAAVPGDLTGLNAAEFAQTEQELRRQFQTYSVDRQDAARLAEGLKSHLRIAIDHVAASRYDANATSRLAETLLLDDSARSGNWDRSAQLFLAIAALRQDSGHVDADAEALLEAVRRGLAFEVRDHAATAGERLSSPNFPSGAAEFSAKQRVHQLFLKYHEHLRKKREIETCQRRPVSR